MDTAKLFQNGNSQAVRLPKEFRIPGNEVKIFKKGNQVILEPMETTPDFLASLDIAVDCSSKENWDLSLSLISTQDGKKRLQKYGK